MYSGADMFSAIPALTGYLYQCRYALLESLRRLRDEMEFQVYIETLDDIEFKPDSGSMELLQTKHHISSLLQT